MAPYPVPYSAHTPPLRQKASAESIHTRWAQAGQFPLAARDPAFATIRDRLIYGTLEEQNTLGEQQRRPAYPIRDHRVKKFLPRAPLFAPTFQIISLKYIFFGMLCMVSFEEQKHFYSQCIFPRSCQVTNCPTRTT